MHHNGRKVGWIQRALATHHIHIEKLKSDELWTIEDTANLLERSTGSICEDLLIVNWLKTHESKLKTFQYAKDALAFIRKEKRRVKLLDVNMG